MTPLGERALAAEAARHVEVVRVKEEAASGGLSPGSRCRPRSSFTFDFDCKT